MGSLLDKGEEKNGKKKKSKHFEDGHMFHDAFNVGKLTGTDRMKLAIPILEGLGAKVDDIVTISSVKGNTDALFMSIISQDTLDASRLDIDQRKIESFKKALIRKKPEWGEGAMKDMVEGIKIVMRIKSQMRIGTKNEIERMMEEIGASNGDYIALQYCANPPGWFLLLIKQENIPTVYLPTGAEMMDNGHE